MVVKISASSAFSAVEIYFPANQFERQIMSNIDILKTLKELISIPSPYFHEEKIALRLEEILESMGFRVSRQPVERIARIDGQTRHFHHHNVLAEKGDGGRSFLLYGHIDTVPVVGAWEEMGMDPFKPVMKDGRLYGLGACDMKGGDAAILKAVDGLEPNGYKIKICFGVDEEYESKGGLVLVGSDFLKDCAGCIVPEVGSGNAVQAPENIVTGRHGRNRVGVRVTGRAAHASTPEFIINPIEYALEFIRETGNIDLGNDEEMPPGNVSIAAIHAEGGGLSSPEECVIWFDNLYSPPMKSAGIFAQYGDICKRLNEKYQCDGKEAGIPRFSLIDLTNLSDKDLETFAPRTTPFMEPWKIDRDHPLVKCASQAVRKVTGKEPVCTCGKSNADENYIGQIIPTLVIPPMGGNEHQGGEYVFPESVKSAAEVIRETMEEYMKQLN